MAGHGVHHRRVGQFHKHALRAILKKPMAVFVMQIIAIDECGDLRIADGFALDQPIASAIQR